jgi:hypothetical protein
VVIWSGSLQAMTPSQIRIWGDPCWSASGELAVTAFDGIRRGIVTIDPASGMTRWWSHPASASYRLLALAPGGQDALAVCCDHDGSAWLVRAGRGDADHRLQMLRPADAVPVSVITWAHDGIALAGLLAAAPGAGLQVQAAWLGGDPGQSPGRWAASPIEYVDDIRTPMLLAYSAGSGLAVHGTA